MKMLNKKRTKFRKWLFDMWADNREERDKFGIPRLTFAQYVLSYKWWLKRKYRKEHD